MAFTIDYSAAQQGFTLIDPGKYECVIMEVKPTTAKSGTQGFTLTVKIRDDVEQKAARSLSKRYGQKRRRGSSPAGF